MEATGGGSGRPAMSGLLFFLFLFSFLTASASTKQGQVYIVYLGEHAGEKSKETVLDDHHALLLSVKGSEEEARASLLYSYKHSLNGFAALLSDDEATKLSERTEVVSTFRSDGRWSPHTTRSWEFVGLEEGFRGLDSGDWLPSGAHAGENVIVGMLDSGIWPESRSFGDEGLGPVPARWKGVCQGGDSFNASSCNRKVIGARYYLKAYEAHHGRLNATNAYRSPRDHDGHGTHTASTVAGRAVPGVAALGGFAAGAASGGAPLARLAIYKVCWPIPGPNPNIENTCFDADMLAAMDDAVGDGVDVMSVSIGSSGKPPRLPDDGIAVGALHAARHGVVVVCSGGNSGPAPATVSNLAPWILTVGASSIDRSFNSPIRLGNGMVIMGQTVTPYQLPANRTYPMVYAAHAVVPGTPANVTNQCLPNSLSPKKVRGKIVVCLRGSGLRVGKGLEVKRAGGAAIVLGNPPMYGSEVPVDAHVLPGTAVSMADVNTILKYINSSANPTAYLERSRTVVDVKPSPVMAQFSSRGPNVLEPSILKPDVTAPGLNILAAWSEASSPTKLDGDNRVVKYNIMSGTSMSCPHVSATAVLLKSAHPDWSAAAIRSAIMTTATANNAEGGPIMNGDGTVAGPMDYGSGHIRPRHALDPGLVYDASFQDYLIFACASGGAQLDHSFPCPASTPRPYELNYPSVAIHGLNRSATVRRTVTNVGQHEARYTVAVVEPAGFSVKVSPTSLAFARTGEKKTFAIRIEATGKRGRRLRAQGCRVMEISHESLLHLRFARSCYRGMLSWSWSWAWAWAWAWAWVVMAILSATPSSGARQLPGTSESDSEHPDPAWKTAALVVGALALTTVVGVGASLQSFLGLKVRADRTKSRGRAAAGADRSAAGGRQSAHDHDKKEELDVYQLPTELHLPQKKGSLFSFLWTSFPWRRSGNGAVHWLGRGVLTSPVRLELRQAPNRRRLAGRQETTVWEYEYDMLAAATSNFHKKMKLGPGQGRSGMVFKGTLLGNDGLDRLVAIKRFHNTLTEQSSKHVHRDLGRHFLQHRNIVRLLGYCLRKGKLYLVYDYMLNGSLDRHLLDATGSSPALTWARRSKIIRGVALGLNHLHSNKYVHGSVKASNVMLEKDLTARLGDLAYSRMEPSKPLRNCQAYIAPECAGIPNPNPTTELDVFYFGALVLEVVCGRRSCRGAGDIMDGDTSFRFLADWVWALHGKGRILDAVDPSLQSTGTADGELQQDEEAKKLLLIALACSHPDPKQRLKMGDVVEMLQSGTSSPPTVPPLKPEYQHAPAESRITVG